MPYEPMLSTKKTKSIVGLDIEAGSAAAAEVRANGSVEVLKHGVIALEPGAFKDGEVTDPGAVAEALKELFAEHKLSRNVRLGVANQRVAVRILRLPPLDGSELESAIRFQAQEHIPMPLDQAVLDWQVIERVEGEPGQGYVNAVAVAARRDMIASMLDALRRAGLRPVGIDHSAFGLIRALGKGGGIAVAAPDAGGSPGTEPVSSTETPVEPGHAPMPPVEAGHAPVTPVEPGHAPVTPEGVADPADASDVTGAPAAESAGKLYCNLADATNLAVARDGVCLFTRISPFGVDAIAQRLAERQQLALDEAHEWLVRVGLDADLEQVDGEPEHVTAAREALNEGVTKLADELRMSLDYYAAQEGAIPVEGVVACGWGAAIPGLLSRIQQEVGRPFEFARPTALNGLDEGTANRLTLPYGIALEE